MAVDPYGTWGAPTNRHVDTDIQSGKGKMGNTLLVDNVNKSVMRGDWCDPFTLAVLRPQHKYLPSVAQAYTDVSVHSTIGSLFRFMYYALFC